MGSVCVLISQGVGVTGSGFSFLWTRPWRTRLEWRACTQTPFHPVPVVRASGLRIQHAGEIGRGQLGGSRGLRVTEGLSAAGREDGQGKAGRPGSQSRSKGLAAASAFSRLFVLLKIQT